jgi:transcriptional regulator with XRE-family HTH domain
MDITGRESAAARALLGWTLKKAAEASGVSWRTISDFEGDRPPGKRLSKLAMRALVKSYEDAGLEFIDGGGVALKRA